MTACIFAGPSLPPAARARLARVLWLPPAAQGDLYRAARTGPAAIGLIDGYFGNVASVWHKEILWALERGIHVYGAASIGALRAAELADFGMHGIGVISAAYRDGTLQDDDEVALLHGPAETGYLPLSEPMVNLRSSFAAAVHANVLTEFAIAPADRVRESALLPGAPPAGGHCGGRTARPARGSCRRPQRLVAARPCRSETARRARPAGAHRQPPGEPAAAVHAHLAPGAHRAMGSRTSAGGRGVAPIATRTFRG